MPTFSAPYPITQGAGTDLRANWTPDGQWIVFERLQAGRRRLHRVHPDGSDLEPLALEEPDGSDSTGRPAFFAPNDVVFVSDRLGRTALFRETQGQVTPLHASEQPCYGPALGTAGTWPLLYFQSDGSDATHISALGQDGQVTRLTHARGVQDQPWPFPDGQSFVYHAREDGRHVVCLQSVQAGAAPVVLSDADEETAYVTPFPSPDGRWIAFTSARGGQAQVWVMRPDGSERQQVTSGAPHSFPAWSPDGRALVCTQGTPTAEVPSGYLVIIGVS